MTGNRTERVSAVVVAAALLGFFAWVLLTLPIQPALILVVAGTLAWVGWVTTSYAHPVRSRKVIATYLCAVSFQLVHMAEEYTGGFPHEIVQLFHSSRPWSERSFLLTFVFGFGALWVLAAAGALYQVRIANFMLWFYALGGRPAQRGRPLRVPRPQGRLLPRPLDRRRASRAERPAGVFPGRGVASPQGGGAAR